MGVTSEDKSAYKYVKRKLKTLSKDLPEGTNISITLDADTDYKAKTMPGNMTLTVVKDQEGVISRVRLDGAGQSYTLTVSGATKKSGTYNDTSGIRNELIIEADANNDLYYGILSFTAPAAADTTSPTISVNSVGSLTTTGGTYSTQSNETGTVKWMVTTSSTTPSKSAILAGTGGVAFGSVSVTAGVTATAGVTGLSPSTTYYVHAYAIDGSANESAPITSSSFTTAASDTTAPSYTSTYPKVDTATSSGFTVRTNLNESGSTYYVVVADGASAPSVAQVKAGQDSTGSAALASGTITVTLAATEYTAAVTGRSASTAYDVYFVSQDTQSTPNVQSAVTKVDISTSAVSDTTPPTFTTLYPKADTTTSTGFTVRVSSSEAGTAYVVVVADGASAPTSAQVKLGQDASGVAALASATITLTSASTEYTSLISTLNAATAYDVYVVAQDNASTPNLQTSPTKVDVTTASGLFELNTISSYKFWLNAANNTRITKDGSNLVTSVTDNYGNGITMAKSGGYPVHSDVNDEFDLVTNSGGFSTNTVTLSGNSVTIAACLTKTVDVAQSLLATWTATTQLMILYAERTSEAVAIYDGTHKNTSYVIPMNTKTIVLLEINGTTFRVYDKDGNQLGSDLAISNLTFDNRVINISTGGGILSGKLNGFALFNSVLTGTEKTNVLGRFKTEYGL
jgi:hypothetical protein